MNDSSRLKFFFNGLTENFSVFAPQGESGRLKIQEVRDFKEIDWSGEIPLNSWKRFFLPAEEILFKTAKGKFQEYSGNSPAVACFGVNVLDLKALTLLDQVFSRDSYYQKRRRNILVIGFSPDWPNDYRRLKVFSHNFEEDILEHLVFDIFFAKLKNGRLKIYSGSEKGQRFLEKQNLQDYQHLEFAGPISESGPDRRMLELKKLVANSENHPLWRELDRICLACGKCALVCPTCFCFDIFEQSAAGEESRRRRWSSCFFNDFSKMAGGSKPLDSVKKKIYFWYYHKFVRIPEEYKLPGCVGCGRCVQTCPVEIDIVKNLKKLKS